jgi:hypothetical protein
MDDSDELELEPRDDEPPPADEAGHSGETEPEGDAERNVAEASSTDLLRDDDAEAFRSRWVDIQAGFVDEPRKSVEGADRLVVEVMERVTDGFSQERSRLEHHWGRGEDVSTEDLRVALQRYRSFFERLLAS